MNKFNLKILEQQTQLSTIIDNLPLASWLKDAEDRCFTVNKKYEECFGKTKKELIGKKIISHLIEDKLIDQQTANELLNDDTEICSSHKTTQKGVLTYVQGKPAYIQVVKVPALDENNNFYGILGMAIDITESKNYETLLLKLKEREETNQDLNDSECDNESNNIIEQIVKDLGLSKEEAQVILLSYIDELKVLLPDLSELVKSGNYNEVKQTAHSIKGASGNLRLEYIYNLSKTLEIEAANSNLENAPEIVKSMTEYVSYFK